MLYYAFLFLLFLLVLIICIRLFPLVPYKYDLVKGMKESFREMKSRLKNWKRQWRRIWLSIVATIIITVAIGGLYIESRWYTLLSLGIMALLLFVIRGYSDHRNVKDDTGKKLKSEEHYALRVLFSIIVIFGAGTAFIFAFIKARGDTSDTINASFTPTPVISLQSMSGGILSLGTEETGSIRFLVTGGSQVSVNGTNLKEYRGAYWYTGNYRLYTGGVITINAANKYHQAQLQINVVRDLSTGEVAEKASIEAKNAEEQKAALATQAKNEAQAAADAQKLKQKEDSMQRKYEGLCHAGLYQYEIEDRLQEQGFKMYKSDFEDAPDGSTQLAQYFIKMGDTDVSVRLQAAYSISHYYCSVKVDDTW